jgi:MinD-like ATPase involved in chromosome partitioning or flagellar assembly
VTVSGGRGAVGKSAVAANLAWALAQGGRRVAVVDLDPEAPSQHTLLGAVGNKPGLEALLAEGRTDAALSETRHPNLWVAVGAAGGVRLGAAARLRERVRAIDVDIVVIDVGVATGEAASGLLELGHHRIAVASPQGNSVHDAYGLWKRVVMRAMRAQLETASQLGLYEPSSKPKDGEKVADLLERVRLRDPALAEEMTESLDSFGAAIVGIDVQDGAQVGVFQALAKMAFDFLGIRVPLLGWLRANARLPDLGAIRGAGAGGSEELRAFRRMAEALFEGEPGWASEDVPIEVDVPETLAPVRRTHVTPPPIPIADAASRGSQPRQVAVGPNPIKPRVHAPLPRRPRQERKKPEASEPDVPGRRRKMTLPGMPPARVLK